MSGKTKKKANIKVRNLKQNKPSGSKKDLSTATPKWAIAAVIIFTALIYLRALNNGFANLDDDDYILKNPYIRDFSLNGIKAIFTSVYFGMYHPLTTLSYLFEFRWFGMSPPPYHIINILFHLLSTWVVYKFVDELSGNKITALIVSALFAIHPMHVESVVWIAERKDVRSEEHTSELQSQR